MKDFLVIGSIIVFSIIFFLVIVENAIRRPRKPVQIETHEPIKLCRDCGHYRLNPAALSDNDKVNFSLCERPTPEDRVATYIDPSFHEEDERFCTTERCAVSDGYCGRGAKFFEPKEESVRETPMEMRV